jgi:2-oxoglutarate ferredoxin oxidoreductase subunit alpha
MDKRLRKLEKLAYQYPTAVYKRNLQSSVDLLLIGIGSTRGAIEELIPWLEQDSWKVNHAHIRLLHPFPAGALTALIKSAKKVLVIENNATGQLAGLLKMQVGSAEKQVSILKYDGTPFRPSELYAKCKEVL